MDHIYWLKTQIWVFLYFVLNLKRNLPMKFNILFVIQLVCLLNSWIWFLSDIKLIMLSISLKDWKIRLILKSYSITLILWDTSLKSETSKFFKVMIIQDFIVMFLSIHQLALISWDSWKIKWKSKVVIQEQWMKFKIFSRNSNLNISEHHWKNSG